MFCTKSESHDAFDRLSAPLANEVGLYTYFESQLAKVISFARTLATTMPSTQDTLIWMTEYGIWPSFENRYLFKCLRAASGSPHPVQDRPGHILEAGQEDVLVSYMHLMIEFGWGGYIICPAGQTRLFLSHDQWLNIETPDPDTLEAKFIDRKLEVERYIV